VTKNAARAIGLNDFEIKVGAPANLVVTDQPNVLEVLRYHERPVCVVSHGKLVDQKQMDEIIKANS
jgi:cytosine deaminase